MIILPLLGYTGLLLGLAFLTLSIASGLYYLSEVVEEHTVLTSNFLRQLIYVVCGALILLGLLDRFPLLLILVSVVSHGVYALNLRSFPVVALTSPVFLLSCALVLLNHTLWFRHFSSPPPVSRFTPVAAPPTFTEISSFFGLCVWLVPFSLFVSLSASDNVLPTSGSETPRTPMPDSLRAGSVGVSRGGIRREGLVKQLVGRVKEWVDENGELMGFWRGERTRPSIKGV